MIYKYAVNKESFEDLSSGRVLYNFPGFTAFPVRIIKEIGQRCFTFLENASYLGPFTIYDPCCGGAYLLTSLGFLYPEKLKKIIASDISQEALGLAKRNLSLLSEKGIKKRIAEIETLIKTYHKDSHKLALQSALALSSLINPSLEVECFIQDIAQKNEVDYKVDIIITDFPYGDLTHWHTKELNPIENFLLI